MARKRPTVVTVMAILNLVLGGLGVAGYCCMAIGAIFLVSLMSGNGPTAPGAPDLGGLFKAMDQAVPSYKFVLIASTLISLVTTALLIISGVGLLKMQPYGRTLSLAYAGITLVMTLVAQAYLMGYANPAIQTATETWVAQEQAKVKGSGPYTPPPRQDNTASELCGASIGVIYSIALLIVMFMPNVKRAFDPSAPDDDYGSDPNRYDTGPEGGYQDPFPRGNLPPDDRYT